MLYAPLFVFFFAQLLVMSCALGFDYVMWIIPVLVAGASRWCALSTGS